MRGNVVSSVNNRATYFDQTLHNAFFKKTAARHIWTTLTTKYS